MAECIRAEKTEARPRQLKEVELRALLESAGLKERTIKRIVKIAQRSRLLGEINDG